MKTSLISLMLLFTITVHAKTLDRIVAVVNNEILTESDIQSYKKQLQNNGLLDKVLLSIKDPKKLLSDRKYLINHLVDEKIIDSEIKKQKLTATIEQVEREIRELTSGKRGGPEISREQLKNYLANQGVLFSDYQNFIKKTLERRILVDREIKSKVKISENEITTQYLLDHGNKNTKAFEYHLSNILLLNSNGGSEAAHSRAKAALKKVSSSSFEAAAEQFSEDPNFSAGGFMGVFKSGELRPEVEKIVMALDQGEYSKIIKTSFGYQIVKLKKKTLIEDPSVQKEKQNIKAKLTFLAINTQLKNWLEIKREQAFIRFN